MTAASARQDGAVNTASARQDGAVNTASARQDGAVNTASARPGGAAGGRLVARLGGGLTAVSAGLGRVLEDPRRAVRPLAIVAGALAVLVALLGWASWHHDRAEQARVDATAAAATAVPKLLSYNFASVDHQVADTQGLLTGDFKAAYAALVTQHIAGATKDQQVAVQTQVVSDSVVSASTGQVVLLMFVNQQSEAGAKPDPTLTGSRLRVTLQHVGDAWLISDLTPV